MTNERWEQFVEIAKGQFTNVDVSSEELVHQGEDGPESRGNIDILEFDHPSSERYRLERENKPMVLEKKMHFSKRASDTAKAEYVFSETEFSHHLRVYKESMSGDWEEVTLGDLGLE